MSASSLGSVSICIPAHNAAATVARAVESALGQTGVACEVIVVDDGSMDATPDVLRSWGDRVRVITQPARGGNAARNAAVAAATGEWLQFLDADDELLPDKISCQLAEGDAKADLLVGPVLVEEGGQRTTTTLDSERDVFESWMRWDLPQTGGALWRQSALEQLGGWEEAMPCCQEHELYLRALIKGVSVCITSSARAVYHIWSQETVCRRDPVRVVEVKTALLDHAIAFLRCEGKLTEAHRREWGRVCFEMARMLAATDRDRACAYYADRVSKGAMRVEGAAAPRLFRLVHALLGFRIAEGLAAARRAG